MNDYDHMTNFHLRAYGRAMGFTDDEIDRIQSRAEGNGPDCLYCGMNDHGWRACPKFPKGGTTITFRKMDTLTAHSVATEEAQTAAA